MLSLLIIIRNALYKDVDYSYVGKMAKRKRRRRVKRIKGKGLFKNIQNWVVKTAIGISPIPGLQRELKPKIRKKGWKKDKPL